jgi:hypothetical protein
MLAIWMFVTIKKYALSGHGNGGTCRVLKPGSLQDSIMMIDCSCAIKLHTTRWCRLKLPFPNPVATCKILIDNIE